MQLDKKFMTDEEREVAKKLLLQIAESTSANGVDWIMRVADKIRNNEPVDDDMLYQVYMFNQFFNLIWDGTHKNN